jgi:hypothetical protein
MRCTQQGGTPAEQQPRERLLLRLRLRASERFARAASRTVL